MDLKQEGIAGTRIERGVPYNRKHLGQYWTVPGGTFGHSTLWCKTSRKDEMVRFPYYEEDGQVYVVQDDHTFQAEVCPRCPTLPTDESWRDRAACHGTVDERFFSEEKTERAGVIADYCDQCPVALDCLDYATVADNENIGGVFGGLFFVRDTTKRRSNIADQRERLVARGSS